MAVLKMGFFSLYPVVDHLKNGLSLSLFLFVTDLDRNTIFELSYATCKSEI